MKRLLSCLFFLMFLIGCRNTTAMPPLVVTVTPEPTAVAVVEVVAEPTNIPATALPFPTETPQPEPTETALPEPTATVDPIVAFSAEIETLIAQQGQPPEAANAALIAPFFYGVYGGETFTRTGDTHPIGDLLWQFSGNTYGIIPSNITVQPEATLPDIDYQSLNVTNLPIAAVIYSGGWGADGQGEALLYLTEVDGKLQWMGAILSFDNFTPLVQLAPVPPPAEFADSIVAISKRQAHIERLSKLIDGNQVYSLNRSATHALVGIRNGSVTINGYELLDVESGNSRPIQLPDDIIRIRGFGFDGFDWIDDKRALIGVQLAQSEEGPNLGHPAILDITTDEVTILDSVGLLFSVPSVADDGTVFYTVDDNPTLWKDGQKLGLTQASTFATAISADASHVVWAEKSDKVDEKQNGGIKWVFWDVELQRGVDLLETDGTIVGSAGSAVISNNGHWVAITPLSDVPSERGVWVISADGSNKTHLGYSTRNATWLDATWLLFDVDVFGTTQQHVYNANTGEQLHIDVDAITATDPLTVANTSSGPRIFTSGAPISFQLPDGWEAEALSRENLVIYNGNAELLISVVSVEQPYICPAVAGFYCEPSVLPDGDSFYDQDTLFVPSLRKPLERFTAIDETGAERLFFVDRDGDAHISAENHNLTITLAGKTGLTPQDMEDVEDIIRTIWFDTPYAAWAFEGVRSSDVWWTHSFDSPDGNWTATSYTIGDVETEPTAYEIDHGFTSHRTRQLFTIQRGDASQEMALIDLLEGTGIGVGYFSALAWRDDALYFSYLPIPHGCGDHVTGVDLWRYDFATGQVRQLAGNAGGGVRALSPDSNFLASSSASGFWLHDLSTNTLTEYALGIPQYEVRQLSWSPDGETIVVVHTARDQMGCFLDGDETGVVAVDLKTGQMQPAESMLDKVEVDEWLDADTLSFETVVAGSPVQHSSFDTNTGVITMQAEGPTEPIVLYDQTLNFTVSYPPTLTVQQEDNTVYFYWPVELPLTTGEAPPPYIYVSEFYNAYLSIPLEKQFADRYYASVEFTPTLTTQTVGNYTAFVTTDLPSAYGQISYIVGYDSCYLVFSLTPYDEGEISAETAGALEIMEQMIASHTTQFTHIPQLNTCSPDDLGN